MKISVSGWPGSGSTSLCLILAMKLNLKLIQGSQFFRYIVKKLSDDSVTQGEQFSELDNYIGKHLDRTYDSYIDMKLKSNDSFIVESDIAGFRLGKQDYFFSIFLTVDQEERRNRMLVDGRNKDMENILKRDEGLAERYKAVHGVNFFDLKEINEKHRLVLDTSKKPIAEELILVYENLHAAGIITGEQKAELQSTAIDDEKSFWTEGKDKILEHLKKNSILFSGEDIIKEIRQEFPDAIEKLPENLKTIIKSV